MAFAISKPRIPIINWGNRLSQGIVLDSPIFEGSGSTVRDIGPNKFNGTKQSTSAWVATRKMRFANATNDYIQYGTGLSQLITDRVTIVFRKKKTDATNRVGVGFWVDNTVNNDRLMGCQLPFNDGVVSWFFGITERVDVSGLTFGDDTWIFTAGPTTKMTIWQNGKLVGSGSNAPTRNNTVTNFQVNRGTSGFFGDLMDCDLIRVYNRELSKQEIEDTFENPWRIYRKNPTYLYGTSTGGTFVAGALTKYSSQEALNSIKGSGEHQYTLQEIANIYAGNQVHSKTFQEVLNGYAGIGQHTKSEQEQLFANIAANLGFTGTANRFSVQELLNMAKNSSLSLQNVIEGTGFSSFSATGGTITTSGSYTIHTFTSSGTFTATGSKTVEVLVVGGGGGGGRVYAGGGGGGGVVEHPGKSITTGAYTVTIGAGGIGKITVPGDGTNGGDSVFDTITAVGGGKGTYNGAGGTGGSGGGGNAYASAGGASTQGASGGGTGYGFAGGAGGPSGANTGGGGGGGAGGVGADSPDANGGAGGVGRSNSISGAAVTYAAGGKGGDGSGAGSAGGANTGNGGAGGGGNGTYDGKDGGSGIVIVRYLT